MFRCQHEAPTSSAPKTIAFSRSWLSQWLFRLQVLPGLMLFFHFFRGGIFRETARPMGCRCVVFTNVGAISRAGLRSIHQRRQKCQSKRLERENVTKNRIYFEAAVGVCYAFDLSRVTGKGAPCFPPKWQFGRGRSTPRLPQAAYCEPNISANVVQMRK